MSTFAAYGRLDKGIAADDVGTIRHRWEYGRRLLMDPTKTTPAGNLRNEVLEGLVTAARRQGVKKIGRREIQHRLQAARTYPSEAHIAQVLAQYESWWQVISAGFPAIQLPLDADTEPFDPRTPEERARDLGQAAEPLAKKAAGQLELFDYFSDTAFDELSTIAELRKYAAEMSEWTERQARRDRERTAYVDRLSAAVGGDEGKTWAEAQAALDAQGGGA